MLYAVWALEKHYAYERDMAKTVEIPMCVDFFVLLRRPCQVTWQNDKFISSILRF